MVQKVIGKLGPRTWRKDGRETTRDQMDVCTLSDIVLIWVSESETTLNFSSCIERNDGVGDASGGGGDLNVGVLES